MHMRIYTCPPLLRLAFSRVNRFACFVRIPAFHKAHFAGFANAHPRHHGRGHLAAVPPALCEICAVNVPGEAGKGVAKVERSLSVVSPLQLGEAVVVASVCPGVAIFMVPVPRGTSLDKV